MVAFVLSLLWKWHGACPDFAAHCLWDCVESTFPFGVRSPLKLGWIVWHCCLKSNLKKQPKLKWRGWCALKIPFSLWHFRVLKSCPFPPTSALHRWLYLYRSPTSQCTWSGPHWGPLRCTYCHNSSKASFTPGCAALFCFLDLKCSHIPSLVKSISFPSAAPQYLPQVHSWDLSARNHFSFLHAPHALLIFYSIFFLILNVNMLIVDYRGEKNIKREIRIMYRPPSSSVNIGRNSFQSFLMHVWNMLFSKLP